MARRREPEEAPGVPTPTPPGWILRTLDALREFHQRGLADGPRRRGGPWTVPEGFTQWWKAERDGWCRKNGCWRTGKTCEKAGLKPCDAYRQAAE